MKHLFVPYELALLAKEKGFNEPCFGYYSDTLKMVTARISFEDFNDCKNSGGVNLGFYGIEAFAPLYQQLIDYFRETHNIVISIKKDWHQSEFIGWYAAIDTEDVYTDIESYDSYYKAFDAALTEAFKLI